MVQHACLNVVPWIKPRLLSEEVQPFIFIFSGAWVNDANPIRAISHFIGSHLWSILSAIVFFLFF